MNKKSQTVWWRVSFTDNVTDEINPMVKFVLEYTDENFRRYIPTTLQRVLQWDSRIQIVW